MIGFIRKEIGNQEPIYKEYNREEEEEFKIGEEHGEYFVDFLLSLYFECLLGKKAK
jgi:hypothetical protein